MSVPNCHAKGEPKVTARLTETADIVLGDVRLVIVADRYIKHGEELLLDYGEAFLLNEKR